MIRPYPIGERYDRQLEKHGQRHEWRVGEPERPAGPDQLEGRLGHHQGQDGQRQGCLADEVNGSKSCISTLFDRHPIITNRILSVLHHKLHQRDSIQQYASGLNPEENVKFTSGFQIVRIILKLHFGDKLTIIVLDFPSLRRTKWST